MEKHIGEIIFWGALLLFVVIALGRSEQRVAGIDKILGRQKPGARREDNSYVTQSNHPDNGVRTAT